MIRMILVMGALLLPLSGVQAHDNYSHGNKHCKKFNDKIRIQGKHQRVKGVACRNHRGDWEIVNDDYYDYDDYSRQPSILISGLGFGISVGDRHHRRYDRSGYRWRGGDFLRAKQYKHKRKWKKRGGNSYSHLIRKDNKSNW